MRRVLRWIVWGALGPLVLGSIAWAGAALWLDGPASRLGAGVLASGFVLAALGVLFAVRPHRRAVVVYGALFAVVLAWWLSLAPSNDREWQPDVARPATATIDGDQLTIHNLRNFDYRSTDEAVPRWETRTYDLSRLTGMDLYFFHWGSPWIA